MRRQIWCKLRQQSEVSLLSSLSTEVIKNNSQCQRYPTEDLLGFPFIPPCLRLPLPQVLT